MNCANDSDLQEMDEYAKLYDTRYVKGFLVILSRDQLSSRDVPLMVPARSLPPISLKQRNNQDNHFAPGMCFVAWVRFHSQPTPGWAALDTQGALCTDWHRSTQWGSTLRAAGHRENHVGQSCGKYDHSHLHSRLGLGQGNSSIGFVQWMNLNSSLCAVLLRWV